MLFDGLPDSLPSPFTLVSYLSRSSSPDEAWAHANVTRGTLVILIMMLMMTIYS
jgi:hypothetical protein